MDATRLTRKEFDEMLEYSCSIPTGKAIGKRWKRDENFNGRTEQNVIDTVEKSLATDDPWLQKFAKGDWLMGEYMVDPEAKMCADGKPDTVLIKWTRIEIIP